MKTLVKLLICMVLFFITTIVVTNLTVPFTNELAVNQLNNDNVDFYRMTLFYQYKNLLYLVPTVISALILNKEIKNLFKKEKKNEKSI